MTRPKGLDWMPFDIAAFYDSERVACLSPAAEALYIRLLCRCFAHGSLPLTSAFVKPLFPKFAEGWDALWEEVFPLFEEVDGRLVNARATAEREHALKVLNARREAGKAGGRPPKTVSEANAFQTQSKAKPQPNHCEPQDRTGQGQDTDRTERQKETRARRPRKPEPEPDHPPSQPSAAPGPLALTREPSRNGDVERKGGNPMTRHWDAEWNRTRPTPWAWQDKDAIALARCAKLSGSSPEEVCRRITRLLESPDKFHVASASPGLLLSQWNSFGFTVKKMSLYEQLANATQDLKL